MKITVKRGDTELTYEEPQVASEYPRLINGEQQNGLILKAIEKCVAEFMKIKPPEQP